MKKSIYLKTIVGLTAVSVSLLNVNPAMAKNGNGNGNGNKASTTTSSSTPSTTTSTTTTSTPSTTTSTTTTSTSSGAKCSLTDIIFAGISATSCYNASGNDTGTVDLTKSLSSSFNLGSGLNWSLQGKSDGSSNIGFTAQQDQTSGSLSFTDLFTSGHTDGLSTFVITLKAANSYAAYLFENVNLSSLSSLTGTFNTIGTSVNGRGNAQALSHASIFVANYTPYVAPPKPPEPPVAQPPVAQPPVAQPPVAQPPVAQPPVEQPPVAQPPVEQPPVEQPPAPIVPEQPSSPPPSTTVVNPKNPVQKVPEPATTAALGLMALGALKMKKKLNLENSQVAE
ncbi:PEP-CTERM sorting domain-containing protein [Calothrix sp. NIES-3974]|uniref:PEP-CTERM sorting domain-containing protein n=1 Tax=Calothrix sp. NIES-3974 TaxID=2005462 RepID=UPI000BBCB38A|nr:PEP-CTERM sorting domain-containing protein [Calothrix sp. NIES-3974]